MVSRVRLGQRGELARALPVESAAIDNDAANRNASTGELSRFLWTRGLWLIFVEVVFITTFWQFGYPALMITDTANFAAMNEVWNAWVDPENPPVRACVKSELMHPDLLATTHPPEHLLARE